MIDGVHSDVMFVCRVWFVPFQILNSQLFKHTNLRVEGKKKMKNLSKGLSKQLFIKKECRHYNESIK